MSLLLVAIVSFLIVAPDVVAPTSVVYLNGTAPINGDGSQGSPFNLFASIVVWINNRISTGFNEDLIVYIAPGNYEVFNGLSGSISSGSGSLSLIGTGGSPSDVSLTCSGNIQIISAFASSGGSVSISVFLNNFLVTACPAAFLFNGWTTVTIDSLQLVSNSGGVSPPLLLISARDAVIRNSLFSGNSGPADTGISIAGTAMGNALISNCDFIGNTPSATQSSGAIKIVNGNLTILNTRFLNNGGGGSDGAVIQVRQPGPRTVTIRDCTFTENSLSYVIRADTLSTTNVSIEGDTVILQNQNSQAVILASGSSNIVIGARAAVWQNLIESLQCTLGGTIVDSVGTDLCNLACINGLKFDRCFVCGGDSACLGCDGIPYSTAGCTLFDSDQDGNNDTTDSVAQWTGKSPNPLLLAFRGAAQSINITFGTIEERTPSGTVVASLDLNTLPWFIRVISDQDRDKYQRDFSYFATNGSGLVVQLLQTLYRVDNILDSGGVSFTVNENSLKFALAIGQWPFQSSANSLVLSISFNLSEAIVSESSTNLTNNNFNINSLTFTTANTVAKVNLQQFAIFDNTTRSITVNRIGSPTSTSFEFVFPLPFASLKFDPDFGIVVTGSGDGDGDDTPLIVGLTVGLVCSAFLVVVLALVATFVFLGWKRFSAGWSDTDKMINFSNTNVEL